jgi:hypothetical protein
MFRCKMGELIDCRDEFTIRQQVHRIERAIRQLSQNHRVIVYLESDASKPQGIGFVLYDKLTKQRIALDRPEYYS